MGRLMALALAKQSYAVEVYDAGERDAKNSAAFAAAAMLAPLAESAITEEPVVRMGYYSLNRWRELIEELSSYVFFDQSGTLIVWHRQDEAEAKRFKKILENTSKNIPELTPARSLISFEISDLEPQINLFTQGLLLPDEGQLDNRQLLEVLVKDGESIGVQYHWNTPKELSDFNPTQNEWLIDCRGLGAKSEWNQLRGVRGEVIRLYAPDVELLRPIRLIHPKYPIYIAPKEDHYFVIGATEIESDDLSPVSVRSTLELLSAAYTVHSGFAEARILESTAQCRPTLKNNLPKVDINGRVIKINGLYRHGFMISPAILDATMNWITQESTELFHQLDIDYSLSKNADTH